MMCSTQAKSKVVAELKTQTDVRRLGNQENSNSNSKIVVFTTVWVNLSFTKLTHKKISEA